MRPNGITLYVLNMKSAEFGDDQIIILWWNNWVKNIWAKEVIKRMCADAQFSSRESLCMHLWFCVKFIPYIYCNIFSLGIMILYLNPGPVLAST